MARVIGEGQGQDQTPIQELSSLIPRIRTQRELDIHEFQNYTKAVKKYRLLDLNQKNAPFTYQWLREVHKDMLGEVWGWAGEPRGSDSNIGVRKEKIGSEIHKLLHEMNQWEKQKKSVTEIAAELHHRLVWIHPFENGNGRWARLVTNIYLRKNRNHPIIWPTDPDFVTQEFRPSYIKAMKAADGGDLKPLRAIHEKYGQQKQQSPHP